MKLDISYNKNIKYKIEVICNGMVYTKKSELDLLFKVYYLLF